MKAPRHTSDQRLAGVATWYCLPGRSACTKGYATNECTPLVWRCYAAAGPEIRAALGDWRGRQVRVRAGNASVLVTLIDWCACPGDHVIDLYASVFGQLASLSSGELDVTVSW